MNNAVLLSKAFMVLFSWKKNNPCALGFSYACWDYRYDKIHICFETGLAELICFVYRFALQKHLDQIRA